jgi:hypothetical protein
MTYNDEFGDGFMFALHVLGSMDYKPDLDDIIAQLRSVAKGELSLMPTPEEAIRSQEVDEGKMVSVHISRRKMVHPQVW